ncbi:MAG: MFS transporter, partial [Pseudomonadota bacterium]
MTTVDITSAEDLPVWRRPIALLVLMAIAMPLAFSTWAALLNNFVIERAGFTGVENGWLHTVREIPGFLSFAVVFILLVMREQFLGILSLVTLGVASAVTAWFPTFGGILMVTFIASIGFHFFETVNTSLQLQWISKERAPQMLGWLVAVGSGASLLSYGTIVATWQLFDLSYNTVYMISGGACVLIAVYCHFAFPNFRAKPQAKKMVLKRRYWLYYALQFVAGARRQIFVVFAAFMMVEHFEFDVHEIT